LSNDLTAWAWDVRDVTATQKVVLVRLADRANNTGWAWPSVTSLAEDTGLCERAVRQALRDLEGRGLVMTEQSKGGQANIYRLQTTRQQVPGQERTNPAAHAGSNGARDAGSNGARDAGFIGSTFRPTRQQMPPNPAADAPQPKRTVSKSKPIPPPTPPSPRSRPTTVVAAPAKNRGGSTNGSHSIEVTKPAAPPTQKSALPGVVDKRRLDVMIGEVGRNRGRPLTRPERDDARKLAVSCIEAGWAERDIVDGLAKTRAFTSRALTFAVTGERTTRLTKFQQAAGLSLAEATEQNRATVDAILASKQRERQR
jgi:hypothetical protein